MEKIILAGGFGFIGKNLIEKLHSEYDLVIIDRYIDYGFVQKYNNIKCYEYDFFKNTHINEILLNEEPEYIINLISKVTAERDMNLYKVMIQINLNVLIDLYEASKDLKSLKLFLQFGSGEEYGNIAAPFIETDREYPNSPYSLAKQITTNTAMMLYRNYKFPISVVRPGNIFGKYQDKDKFIPYIIGQLYNNLDIETTPGNQKRDFIYAPEFANGIKLVLKNYNELVGEIFNLSTGRSISLKEIILCCKEYMKSNSQIEFGKILYRENEMMDFELDISKFREATKNSFNIDILGGIKEYIDAIGGTIE